MKTRTLAAASTTLLALTLTACGSSSDLPDLDAGGDAKPATGVAVKGHGYTFHVPSGWTQPTDTKGQTQLDTVAVAPQATDGFRPNVNVVVKKGAAKGDPTDADYTAAEKAALSALKGAGGSDLHVQPRLNLADETALHVTGNAQQGKVHYQTDQYFAVHDGSEYIVTFSFPIATQETASDAVTEPTMASWAWS